MTLARYFDSVAGRMFVFLLIGVVASATLALGAANVLRDSELEHVRLARLADRVQDLISVTSSAPEPLRGRLIQNGVPGIYHARGDETRQGVDQDLTERLVRRIGPGVRAEHIAPATCFSKQVVRLYYSQMRCWLISARLADGTAVAFTMINPIGDDPIHFDPVYLAVLVVAASVLTFFAARMAAGPLRELSRAARTLGADLNSKPLAERGPYEVRDAIGAFNAMQAKQREHVVERTKILASITHDLQTPLTRLRLRLEKVGDHTLRDRLVDDLAVMQILIQEGLDFSRGDQIDEPFEPVELDSLLESLVEDAEEVGQMASLTLRSGCDVEARPRALQRCLSNLLDNALKYGGTAELSARLEDEALRIRIRDHGPGIPADKLEAVFEPFVRLQNPMARMANGAGLGLTIARMLAQKNDAELILSNHPQGGLEATLVLRRGLVPSGGYADWATNREAGPPLSSTERPVLGPLHVESTRNSGVL